MGSIVSIFILLSPIEGACRLFGVLFASIRLLLFVVASLPFHSISRLDDYPLPHPYTLSIQHHCHHHHHIFTSTLFTLACSHILPPSPSCPRISSPKSQPESPDNIGLHPLFVRVCCSFSKTLTSLT
jgi:hypothetical protein